MFVSHLVFAIIAGSAPQVDPSASQAAIACEPQLDTLGMRSSENELNVSPAYKERVQIREVMKVPQTCSDRILGFVNSQILYKGNIVLERSYNTAYKPIDFRNSLFAIHSARNYGFASKPFRLKHAVEIRAKKGETGSNVLGIVSDGNVSRLVRGKLNESGKIKDGYDTLLTSKAPITSVYYMNSIDTDSGLISLVQKDGRSTKLLSLKWDIVSS